MFVHTLGFKKQGCSGIIEDCFVSQQHLMEEAPDLCGSPIKEPFFSKVKSTLFEAFVDLGFIMIWLDKILLG